MDTEQYVPEEARQVPERRPARPVKVPSETKPIGRPWLPQKLVPDEIRIDLARLVAESKVSQAQADRSEQEKLDQPVDTLWQGDTQVVGGRFEAA
jgi:hypothetical protein